MMAVYTMRKKACPATNRFMDSHHYPCSCSDISRMLVSQGVFLITEFPTTKQEYLFIYYRFDIVFLSMQMKNQTYSLLGQEIFVPLRFTTQSREARTTFPDTGYSLNSCFMGFP